MTKKCKYKYKRKCFKTKKAIKKYKSWEDIVKNAPKTAKKICRGYQNYWIGK